jgi:hypothetical protein
MPDNMAKKYMVTPMNTRYRGEDLEGNGIWGTPVEYLSGDSRQAYQVEFRDGKMYDAVGALFDTKDASTVFSSDPRAIFVMDERQFLHFEIPGGWPLFIIPV